MKEAHDLRELDDAASLALASPTNAGGANQAGVRLYNERLLLSLVRRFGPLSKIEVARLTGLSVQSTSAIMNRLQADGLLKREAPLRGRVGQPTVPMSIDPEGAYSFGLKIGRRRCDLVLVDFRGAIRQRAHRAYPFPTPTMILDFAQEFPTLPRQFAHRVAETADRWPWRRRALPGVELGIRDRRAAGRNGRMAPTSTRKVKSPPFVLIRRRCATTRRPPVRPSSSSVGAGGIAIFSISSSGSFSAADWCWTARCVRGARATPPRSDRCRSWPRATAAARGS